MWSSNCFEHCTTRIRELPHAKYFMFATHIDRLHDFCSYSSFSKFSYVRLHIAITFRTNVDDSCWIKFDIAKASFGKIARLNIFYLTFIWLRSLLLLRAIITLVRDRNFIAVVRKFFFCSRTSFWFLILEPAILERYGFHYIEIAEIPPKWTSQRYCGVVFAIKILRRGLRKDIAERSPQKYCGAISVQIIWNSVYGRGQ